MRKQAVTRDIGNIRSPKANANIYKGETRAMSKDFLKDFPYDVEDDIGELSAAEELFPGVYYVANSGGGSRFAKEYYLADAKNSRLSDSAKAFGTPLPHHPDLLAYALDGGGGGYMAVKYEWFRYCTARRLPLPDGETLHTVSAFGMELCPAYFGDFPVPSATPMGFTLRYKPLMPGVFAIETDQCQKVIAVCYPVWSAEFSNAVIEAGSQMDVDRLSGIHNTLGFLFFSLTPGSLAIFELSKAHRQELKASGLLDMSALMNALWEFYPEYAAMYNLQEQAGLHDGLGLLMRSLGEEMELSRSDENMIAVSPGVGTSYLRL